MMAEQIEVTPITGLSTDELIAKAIERNEGVEASNGALAVQTGARTGRSPKDRFIVDDAITHDTVDWGSVNQAINKQAFDSLWHKACEHLSERDSFASSLHVGAHDEHYLPVEVVTEFAWHSVFVRNLFERPSQYNPKAKKPWTILNAATLTTDPAEDGVNSDVTVMINFEQQRVLLCGARYAGEMKKAMFTVLNFILPEKDILPMHCAANKGENGDVALFFGLSGTGKTTLSADPARFLIGDDEHGWSEDATFNFEGGCYAKCIDLSEQREPMIYRAIKHGAIMENVVLNDRNEPVYSDASLSQNSRAGYPRTHIDGCVEDNRGAAPSAVVFLTCDLFGVLPPVAKLTKEQAAYHFLSGYTALVGSTEVGSEAGIAPTFSTCFGAPFFPRAATVYADLLMKRVEHGQVPVYLVNTGWTGGAYGKGGERFAIPTTRAVISAILSGSITKAPMATLPGFNLQIPTALDGVDAALLDPRNGWDDTAAYEKTLNTLIDLFNDNFARFDVSATIINAGPKHLD